ncbi:hypothetical protein ADK53_06790 [Streptomyces sp. WM6373]|uniref:hypothetical protein n=1 Tax=Streptomyces TaxID=1883 RepID=UPI0004C7E0FD|nr:MULTISPECIES: hypothetical protein [unclassified Streptomyces]KJY18287.1 hypothetical protein VR43_25670 [Streptomyces sp. NRRL S-104]KOU42992.1 hypothetical protein ADK53_06790 [Streptomyces sp. WM6373]KOU65738.1 hypothetical protein ADK96_16275 [Streptomyces sp. IGB124]KOU71731.1 hypothetical protein ADK61_30365 [Streptomyces sp. XY66]KOV17304.1 hypothetical protein ADK90_24760 [Streptomyces sp. XY413]
MKRSLIMSTAAVVTGLTLFATACANDPSEGEDTSASGGGNGSAAGGAGADADRAVKMRQCLREHGIDVPDPEPGQDPRGMTLGGGADPQKMQEAMKACGMQGPGSGKEPSQEEKDKELKWIQCMRDNGVALKDPEYSGGARSAVEIPKGQEKAFEEAQKKCEAAR